MRKMGLNKNYVVGLDPKNDFEIEALNIISNHFFILMTIYIDNI